MPPKPPASAPILLPTDDPPSAQELVYAEIEGIEYRVEQELALLRALDGHQRQYVRILNLLLPIRDEQIRLREQLERLTNILAG